MAFLLKKVTRCTSKAELSDNTLGSDNGDYNAFNTIVLFNACATHTVKSILLVCSVLF